jgi:CxxC motif-containing protein (DUF1111 family)
VFTDNKANFNITSHEWKNSQTLEIGLVEILKKYTLFMRVSKTRNLEEAIFQHFGKGENSRGKLRISVNLKEIH